LGGARRRAPLAAACLAWAAFLGAGLPPALAHVPLDEYQRAIAEEIAHHPGESTLYLRQAQAFRVAHQWEAALGAIAQAAAHGAHPEEVRAERGMVYLDAGRPKEAIGELDALLGDAERPLIRFARGRAWMANGRPDRAASDFARAVEHMKEPTPDHVIAWRDALIAAGRRSEALDALDRGMRRVGSVPSLELPAVDLAASLGRFDDAVDRLDVLLHRYPGNEAWLLRKGEILRLAGRTEDARRAFTSALESIETRPPQRRGKRIQDLERRLRDSLASLPDGQKNGGKL
jgi:tetratricopeptide (TPR) repeat protein